ncbi:MULTISPECIES: hypothetical protein [Acidobacterium]|uniref:AtuA-like ferredoxin-fold domain-containing protein n=1 Tax=Acidobacterium capsulatum (strain ATCC 51196 / DSM 11244 / BCRC 80197 / JCM 7670 / NBRC 15755 / NCIMB 13165 / 161) TaxID=240015 RepID=C1F7X3_ACIC5|nr:MULTISPECIES: hypothetical protein [Acidobacterium]ACO31501.1 conserved hypothetical protein [Acidobacterium capsulatum ATCC 51196]HCT59332.1 hypothetical protein [Acidobacterium sp.]
MRLREIAHARTGDKGRLLTISLIAYRAEDFPVLEQYVTAELLSQVFAPVLATPVTRYSVPSLHALNFVLQRAGEKSVTCSLSLDAHGKCLGDVLLDFELSLPEIR